MRVWDSHPRPLLSTLLRGARSTPALAAKDLAHLPSSGSTYHVTISRPPSLTFPWVSRWDQDEGASSCAHSSSSLALAAAQLDIGSMSDIDGVPIVEGEVVE